MGNAKQYGPGAVNGFGGGGNNNGGNGNRSGVMAGAVSAGVASIGAGARGVGVAGAAAPAPAAAPVGATAAAPGAAAAGSGATAAGAGELGVSVTQERAIAALVSGRTAVEAASEAGVSRTTLHRWLREDAAFIAAYNTWRRDATQSARGRMVALTGDAVDALAMAVRGGDGKLALQLLKALGVAAAQPDGPMDAETVRREQELKRMEEESERRKREVFGGF